MTYLPSGRMRRTLFFLITAGSVLLLFLIMTPSIFRPWVREEITQALSSAGLPEAEFTLGGVGWYSLSIINLRTDPLPAMAIEKLVLRYTPLQFFGGHVEELMVTGVECRVIRNGTQVDPGALAALFASPGSATLPVSRITVESVHLSDGTGESIRGGALIEQGEAGHLQCTLHLMRGEAVFRGVVEVSLVNPEVSLRGSVENLLAGSLIPLEGKFQRLESGWSGTAHAVLPAHHLTDESELPKLLGLGRKFEIGGRVGADLSLVMGPNETVASALFDLSDVRMASATWDASLEGLTGRVQFRNLLALSTPPSQALAVTRARLGNLTLGAGRILFRLEGVDTIEIEESRLSLFGGRASTGAFAIDTREFSTACHILLEDLDLQQMLTFGVGSAVSGAGRMDGELTIRIPRWPFISVDEAGFLAVRGPERWLKVHDPAMIEGVLAGVGKEPGQAVTAALTDFTYDDLRLDIVSRGKTRIARIHTRGRARSGEHPQEVGGLTVELEDIDRMLTVLMLGEEWLSRIQPKGNGKASKEVPPSK